MITEEQAKSHIRDLLEFVGEDPDRVGLQETPDRSVRMFKEMFRGYDPEQKPVITTFPNGQDGIVYDNMIVDHGNFYSVCEHHCRTFFGEYWFAYIPNNYGRILGLSKIARVVDYCAARMQVQERLVHDVVEMLSDALGDEYPPQGMALVMKARHMCKESRGARKEGEMVSTCLTGIFRRDPRTRDEFLSYTRKG